MEDSVTSWCCDSDFSPNPSRGHGAMHYVTLHGDADEAGNFLFAVRHTFSGSLNSRPGLDVGACGEVYRLKYSVHGTPD